MQLSCKCELYVSISLSWPLLALLCAVIISTSDLYQCKPRRTWGLVHKLLPCTLNRNRGTTPPFFSPPDVPADEGIWPFKSKGGWAKIHEALITLSVVKLKFYIQSIGFMMPLQHLIEIKCQNAWMPSASHDANQAVDDSNLDSLLSVYK